MATNDTLPAMWRTMFDGERLNEKTGVSALLSTVGEDGWPHASFLGAGEVLARDDRRIALLLWPSSKTAANVARSGRATLYAAAGGKVWEVRLDATTGEHDGTAGPIRFETRVLVARCHDAPYAEVTGMIQFRLLEPEPTIERWRAQIARLRRFA